MRSRFAVVAVAAAAVLLYLPINAHAATEPHPSERGNRVSIGIDRIDQRGNNVDRLYWYERTGAGVSAYVVDSGVNHLNNDFGGRVIPLFDFQRSPGDPSFGLPNDEHGTDVASQVGGRTYGVAKNVTIYSVRVRDESVFPPLGTTQNLLDGLEAIRLHILDANGARRPAVVNMSVVFPNCSASQSNLAACASIESKVQQLVAAGAVVVTGTNNASQSSHNTAPCRLALQSRQNGVICVAGTDAFDDGFTFNDAVFAGSGSPFEILAPAGRIGNASTWWLQHGLSHNAVYGKGGFLNGNSMASPLVAGAVALYMENFAALPVSQHPSPGSIELAVLDNASPIFSGSMVYTGCEFLPPYGENPILDHARFVKQHYLDFLGRQPDTAGFNHWLGQINGDPNCAVDRAGCFGRTNTSRAFFESIENRETNFFAYRLHRMTYSVFPKPDNSGFSTFTNPRMERLFSDGRRIARGVVVGAPNWNVILENNQRAFVNAWVATQEFNTLYPPSMPNQQFVEALYANAQIPFDANGATAVQRLATEQRGPVLFDLVRSDSFGSSNHLTWPQTVRSLWNPMYVLLCYMGYLRRNPDDPPNENDLRGYDGWLAKLNDQTFAGGDPEFARHEMIRAFIISIEYGERFFKGPHCGQPAPPPEEPPIDPGDGGGCGNGMIC